jgi:endo-1,4-beta-xylanase
LSAGHALAQGALRPREEEPLAVRAARRGLVYGAATATRYFDEDPEFAEIFADECGLLVPEWEAKWTRLQPAPGRFDFTACDRLMAFARRHNQFFRGHTLVWHRAMPDWLPEAITPPTAERLLIEHVGPVVARYRGRVHSWDVVNEAIDPNSAGGDGLRMTPWLKAMGPRYFDVAFRAAAAADPDALLVYNDYGFDYATASDEARRRALLTLLEGLRQRQVPVGAVGIQAHLGADGRPFDTAILRRFLADLAAMGLRIIISELDVSDRTLPADPVLRDRLVADMVRRYLEAALDERAVIAVVTWGLADRYSWLHSFAGSKRADGLKSRGLPLDEDFNRKPVWAAMARAFDFAPVR